MPRHRAFETAAARRRRDPIIWTIDDTEVRLAASVDLAEVIHLVETLQAEPQGETPMKALIARRDELIATIRRFVEPDDRPLWDRVASDIDVQTLGEMCSEIVMEHSGAANPTKPSSSPAGSPATGASSTDGAQPEE